jgi:ketosteroid isomerase-like protein
MRIPALVLAAAVAFGSTAFAAAPESPVLAPIHKFIDSFNKGDAAAAASTHAATADLAIVDEVAPFMWQGPKAFDTWASSLDAEGKRLGLTDQSVELGAPVRIEQNGDAAYVVMPSTYRFKQKGKPMIEKARMTFVVKKDASGWLIHSWTWTGPRPQAAPASAPAAKP